MLSRQIGIKLLTLSTVAVLCSATALGQMPADQNSGSMSGASQSKASMADKTFVKMAMQGSMAEVQLGQLATQKTASDDVKQFGQKMVDDHTKLNDQMKPIAEQIGVTAPGEISAKDQALMTKLQGMSGDQFDKAYIRAMLKDHRADLKAFQKEQSSGKDPAVKDAASQGEQVISGHLQMAEQLAKTHNVTSGKMSGAAQ